MAGRPVWVQVVIVSLCYISLGTSEETYLALYAIGVFILLSMTSWAAAKRLARQQVRHLSFRGLSGLSGAMFAAVLTSGATAVIFVERFTQGGWTYLLFIPLIYIWFSRVRARLGEPVALSDYLGRFYSGQYLLPYQREGKGEHETAIEDILVPLDGSAPAEWALPIAQTLCRELKCRLTLVTAESARGATGIHEARENRRAKEAYLKEIESRFKPSGTKVDFVIAQGQPDNVITAIAQDVGADMIVMTTHGRSNAAELFISDVAGRIIRKTRSPVLLVRPAEQGHSTGVHFRRLLVGLDGSWRAEAVLRYARKFAEVFESEILLLGIPEPDVEKELLFKYLESVAHALRGRNLKTRAIVSGSNPAREIVAISESEDAGVILLTKSGRGGLPRSGPLGRVANLVVQTSQRPVLLVQAAEGLRAPKRT